MSKSFSVTAVERRCWQLNELFRAIDLATSSTIQPDDTIIILATLGQALCNELEQYANGKNKYLIGCGDD